MSLISCLNKAGPALSDEDRQALLDRARQHRAEGLPASEAGRMAVLDHLDHVGGLLEAATPREAHLNIGLNVKDGETIDAERALQSIKDNGGEVTASTQHQSDTEPTLVATLRRPLTPEQAHAVSVDLKQESIAQLSGGKGDLYGPEADKWKPFNPDYFVMPDGSRASAPPDIRYSPKREPFYSELARRADDATMKAAPAEGWRQWLRGQKGIKPEEVAWSGLDDWLKMQQGKVTKDQVRQFLDQNGVKVTETVLAEDAGLTWKEQDELNELRDLRRRHEGGERGVLDSQDVRRLRELEHLTDRPEGSTPKFGKYQLPGGENYREVLLTLPESQKYQQYEAHFLPTERGGSMRNGGSWTVIYEGEPDGSHIGRYTTQAEAEQAAARHTAEAASPRQLIRAKGERDRSFRSNHWDEPNVLAHVRLNDRTDADGKRVLFVEEIQSDWGQAGKKKGFLQKDKPTVVVKEGTFKGFWTSFIVHNGVEEQVGRQFSSRDDAQRAGEQLANERGMSMGEVPAAPFVGKTDAWVALALKRVIKMAVDEGYDKVALINGEQSAERYDLSKHVDRIDARKIDSGYSIDIATKDGKDFNRDGLTEESLVDHVGKEMAQKIVEQATGPKKVRFSGLDLKVGGEGMKGFYDTIVPNVAKEVVRKLGGDKFDTVPIIYPKVRTWESMSPEERFDAQADLGPADLAKLKAKTFGGELIEQPGFDITPKMRENAAGGVPLFSPAREAFDKLADKFNKGEMIVGRTSRDYEPAQLEAMRHVGFAVTPPTIQERTRTFMQDFGKRMEQGIVDQFAPVRELGEKPYQLMRLSKGASGALEAFLKGGQLKLVDGVYDFDTSKRGGVIDKLLIPMQGEANDAMRWVAANRAERLAAEGRENLFTPQDIAALKTLDQGQTKFDYTLPDGTTTRDRGAIYKDFNRQLNEFHANILDMAEKSDLIDPAARKLWEKEFYLPFYRIPDEDGTIGMNIKKGVVGQEASKMLKGGTGKLNADLVDNMLQNWAHLLDASSKNRAAKAAVEAAEKMQVAFPADGPAGKGSVYFREAGEKRYSKVTDPYVLTALTSLQDVGLKGPMMKALQTFKGALTYGVTFSPFFKIRLLIRDTVTALATSEIGLNVPKNVAQGWKLTDPHSDSHFRLLAGGGMIHFGSMMEGSEAKRVQSLVAAGIHDSTILDNEGKVGQFYRQYVRPAAMAYNEMSERAEAFSRAPLYDQLVKGGMSHAEASLKARDLMDFSMNGSFATVRFLTQTVPFFNARLQGLYKLGRAAKEDPARASAVIGATALASLALLAQYHNDPDWKKRPDWDRNNYWWFKLGGIEFRIPKPFEVGSIATLAERGFERMFDKEMTNQRFMAQVAQMIGSNLSLNPIPQAAKPLLDVYANKDMSTGRPIESAGMEKLQAPYRYDSSTSMAARGLSTAANAVTQMANVSGPSPLQIDHMLSAYFGWLGTFVVGAGDTLARGATGQPSRPTSDYLKTLSGNMISHKDEGSSRYVTQLYDQAKIIEEAYQTMNTLRSEGKGAEATAFRQQNLEAIKQEPRLAEAKKQEADINSQIRRIENSSRSPDEKRAMIDGLNARKNRVAALFAGASQ